MNLKNRHHTSPRLRPTPIALALSLALGGLAQPALALPAPPSVTVRPAVPTAVSARNIVFIDGQLPNWQALAKAVRPGALIVRLNPQRDEMAQIAHVLQGRDKLESIALLSHGASGRLQLGAAIIDAAGLNRYGRDLKVIKHALGTNGEILLYGCNVGKGKQGRRFIDALAKDTGAVVAASTDLTGAGSDWDLEISTGTLSTAPMLDTAALKNYDYDLATLTVTSSSDAAVTTGSSWTSVTHDLRNAIYYASAGDTIDFNTTSMGGSTVTLSTGSALTISKSLTIDGGTGVTIDANYTSGVFSITAGTVDLKNLTITHGVISGVGGNGGWSAGSPPYSPSAGASSYGAGINNAGTLTLDGVTITANAATGGGGGGGMTNSNGGGGGGGSGANSVGGAAGGNTTQYAGSAGSTGTGGRGGGYVISSHYGGGSGGSSISGGGAGGDYAGASYSYFAAGGSGATATYGSAKVGGGGGGIGYDTTGHNGGAAAGGVYNSGTLYIIGTSTISNNLGAGGGGGGGGGAGNHGGLGGRGVGGIWNAASGYVHITSTNYSAMSGNNGVSGTIGGVGGSGANLGSNTGFSSPAGVNNIYNASGLSSHLDTSYVLPPTETVSSASLSPDYGTPSTDWITDTGSVTISGSLSAALASGDKVEYSIDGGTSWQDLATQPSGTSWSTVKLSLSGSSTFEARVYNSGGSSTAFTHTYQIDTTAPLLSTATVSGDQLVLTYTESGSGIYGSYVPTTSEYAVSDAGSSDAVTAVAVDSVANTVTLTLTTGVANGDMVTVSYTKDGTTSDELQDVAGNLAADLSSQSVTNNTPTSPSAPTMTTGSDTGSSSSDGITSNTQPTFSGTGITGDQVYLLVNDGTTTTVTSTYATVTSGSWSLQLPTALADGSYTITAEQSADGGLTFSKASAAQSITIDTTAPSAPTTAISLTAGSDSGTVGDNITNDTSPTLQVSLAGTGAVAGDSVELLLGGASLTHPTTATLTSTDITNGYVDMTVTSGDLGSDGSKTFTAQVTDIAGNVGTAGGSYTMTLDTTPPTTTVGSIGISADTGASSGDFITNTATQTITGTLSAVLGTDHLYGSTDSGTTWTDITSMVSNTTITWAGATLVSGSNNITFKVVDLAGNYTTPVATGQSYTLDTTPPTEAVATATLSHDTGVSSTDFITKTTSQTISGTLSANLQLGDTVNVSLDNGLTWSGATAATGTNTWSLGGQTLTGSGTLLVEVTDTAGNNSTPYSHAYTQDSTLPTVSSVAASNLTSPTASSFTFTVNYTDNGGGDSIDATSIAAGNVSVIGPGTVGTLTILGASYKNSTGVATYTVQAPNGGVWNSATDAGAYTISINGSSVQDLAGNLVGGNPTAGSFNVNFAPTTVVATAALSQDTGSSSSDWITNTASQTISGTLSANLATGESVQVSFDGGSTWSNATGYTVGSSNWSDTATLSGSGTFEAQVTNTNGSSSPYTQAYTLDQTAPAAPVITAMSNDTGVSSTDGITTDTTPTFTGTADANTAVTIYNGSTAVANLTTDGAGNWSYTSTPLANGSYNFTASATDTAGNTSTSAVKAVTIASLPGAPTKVTATVSNGLATINFTAPSSDGGTAITSYTATASPGGITGSCSGPSACSITLNGLTNGTSYTFSVTASNAIGTGPASKASGSVTATQNVTVTSSSGSGSLSPWLLALMMFWSKWRTRFSRDDYKQPGSDREEF